MSRMRAWLAIVSTLCCLGTLCLFGSTAAGCYSNVPTMFPEDFEPWEEQMSEPAVGTAADPCPETLVHVESRMYQGGHTASVHASACIHAPIATVFDAMRDPETGRDPSVNMWTLFDEPVAEECSNGPAGNCGGSRMGRYRRV